jgi:hypothetical protein
MDEYLKDNPNYTDEEIAKFTIEDRKGVFSQTHAIKVVAVSKQSQL